MYNDMFIVSRDEKKGITLYLSGGQIIPMIVKETVSNFVVGSNREYDTIAVDINKIEAAAM